MSPEAQFDKDLGLDSLDTVEVIMAFEEEFQLEIPDAVADDIKTVREAAQYLLKELHPQAVEEDDIDEVKQK